MKRVAGLVLGLCDVLEAEGRLLRESAWHTSLSCALAAVGALFLGGGFVLLVTAAYHVLCALLPVTLVYVVLGALCLIIALGFLWGARKCILSLKPHANASVRDEVCSRVA